MDAAGDEQAIQSGGIGTGNIGYQAIADYQQASSLPVRHARARVFEHRRIGFTEKTHRGVDEIAIAARNRTG